MLVAGASSDNISSLGGTFMFDLGSLPSEAWWSNGSAFIYIMLVAGAGADSQSAFGGALVFNMDFPPSFEWWYNGSANKFSLLVRVLTTLLPLAVLLHLVWTLFLRVRGGPSVPLLFI